MGNKLKEVTYLTVKDLKSHEIILPGKYSSTFENMAKKLSINFDDDNVVLRELNQDIDYVNKIVEKTNDNLTTLHKSTNDAQTAIKNKDENSLKAINEELAKMQEQINTLQKQLFSDPLTGAFNRKWFSDQYLFEENFKNNGFIAFLDLNKFKIINDNYGHLVGDQVLKYLVKFLKKEFDYPGIDIVRYAGDEFIILIDEEKTTIFNIDNIVKEAQIKLSNQKLKSAKIKELQFSFSYGLTPFKRGDHVENILDIVDELMYKNKETCK